MHIINQHNITLPKRKLDAHKGDNGSVAIIGGASTMLGAVVLASRAALFSGAGRVYASFLADDAPGIDLIHPEIMLREPDGIELLDQLDCIVIGPGMGESPQAISFLGHWLLTSTPILLDADALNLIAENQVLSEQLSQRKHATIITPHPGEAARLLKISSKEVQQNRIASALKLAQQYNAVCILKGHETIVAFQDQSFTNASGNVGLASGGTGDVLSGIIGSLVAQGLHVLDASKTGVYLHGAAADSLVAQGIGPIGLSASEVALETRHILNSIQ